MKIRRKFKGRNSYKTLPSYQIGGITQDCPEGTILLNGKCVSSDTVTAGNDAQAVMGPQPFGMDPLPIGIDRQNQILNEVGPFTSEQMAERNKLMASTTSTQNTQNKGPLPVQNTQNSNSQVVTQNTQNSNQSNSNLGTPRDKVTKIPSIVPDNYKPPTEEELEMDDLSSDINELEEFSKDPNLVSKKDSYVSEAKSDTAAFEKEMKRQNTKGESHIFNPYAGVDIPTAANIFGQSIGKGGDPFTAVASGLKLATGLGRNIVSGIGTANRNQFLLEEARRKQQEALEENSEYREDGGTIRKDIEALLQGVDMPIMQKGGTVNEDELTGSIVRGTNNGDENVEVEVDEFIETPEGTPQKVAGKSHEEGGEKMNLPEGTKVLSDNLTFNVKEAKELSEDLGVKISNKDTYAKALEKFNKKIGLSSLVEEEEYIIKEVKSQKEKAVQKGMDEPTQNINLEFLSSKLKDLTDKKMELEQLSSETFKNLFELQESKKPQENTETVQSEFEIGGTVYSKDQILSLANKYNVSEERALEIINSMKSSLPKAEDGMEVTLVDNTDPTDPKYKKVDKAYAEKMVADGKWQRDGDNKYVKVGSPGRTETIASEVENYSTGVSYEDAYKKPGVEEKYRDKGGFAQFKKEAKAYNEARKKVAASKTIQIPEIPYEYYYAEDPNSEGAGTDKGTPPPPDPTKPGSTPEGQGKEDSSKGTDPDLTLPKRRIDFLALPSNEPLPPVGLQMPMKQRVRFGRLDAETLSPEQRLSELNRGVDAAMDQLARLPSGQRETALMQLQSNKQAQSDRILQETAAANNQIAQQEEMFNIRQGDREDVTNVQLTGDFQDKVFASLANTEDDFRRYYNTGQERNIENFNTINSLNLMNQLSENYNYGNRGVDFEQSGYINPMDMLNQSRTAQALQYSNYMKSQKEEKAKEKEKKKNARGRTKKKN